MKKITKTLEMLESAPPDVQKRMLNRIGADLASAVESLTQAQTGLEAREESLKKREALVEKTSEEETKKFVKEAVERVHGLEMPIVPLLENTIEMLALNYYRGLASTMKDFGVTEGVTVLPSVRNSFETMMSIDGVDIRDVVHRAQQAGSLLSGVTVLLLNEDGKHTHDTLVEGVGRLMKMVEAFLCVEEKPPPGDEALDYYVRKVPEYKIQVAEIERYAIRQMHQSPSK